jgi:hypothetical protein
MGITEKYRKMIVGEIDFVVSKMEQSPTPDQKLYYFSGIYSVIQRVLNFEYDADLVYLHLVLRHTYDAFYTRLQAILKGGESIIPLEEIHFTKLSEICKELARSIEKKQETSEKLKKLAVLSYSTTGNGHYLRTKGLLNIDDL